MNRINIKPLSVNQAWKGKRYRTDKYKKYQSDLRSILPSITIPKGKLRLSIDVGFSNAASDIDNVLKPFIDCLQAKYGFNDNKIYKLIVSKFKVKKGSDYISFKIEGME